MSWNTSINGYTVQYLYLYTPSEQSEMKLLFASFSAKCVSVCLQFLFVGYLAILYGLVRNKVTCKPSLGPVFSTTS